jgi:hypothetical protein
MIRILNKQLGAIKYNKYLSWFDVLCPEMLP